MNSKRRDLPELHRYGCMFAKQHTVLTAHSSGLQSKVSVELAGSESPACVRRAHRQASGEGASCCRSPPTGECAMHAAFEFPDSPRRTVQLRNELRRELGGATSSPQVLRRHELSQMMSAQNTPIMSRRSDLISEGLLSHTCSPVMKRKSDMGCDSYTNSPVGMRKLFGSPARSAAGSDSTFGSPAHGVHGGHAGGATLDGEDETLEVEVTTQPDQSVISGWLKFRDNKRIMDRNASHHRRRGRKRVKTTELSASKPKTRVNPGRSNRGLNLMRMALQESDSDESLFNCSLDSEYMPSSLEICESEEELNIHKLHSTFEDGDSPEPPPEVVPLHSLPPAMDSPDFIPEEDVPLRSPPPAMAPHDLAPEEDVPLRSPPPAIDSPDPALQEVVPLRSPPPAIDSPDLAPEEDVPLHSPPPAIDSPDPALEEVVALRSPPPAMAPPDLAPEEDVPLRSPPPSIDSPDPALEEVVPLRSPPPAIDSPDLAPEEDVPLRSPPPAIESPDPALEEDVPLRSPPPAMASPDPISGAHIPLENSDSHLARSSPKKKKTRDITKWKDNIRRQKRLKGESYLTRQGKVMPEKKIKEAKCSSMAKHNCCTVVTEENRVRLYTDFRNLTSLHEQRAFVVNHVTQKKKNRNTKQGHSRREFTNVYTFTVAGDKQVVCREFFLDTLNITGAFVKGAMKKLSPLGTLTEDRRGKKTPANKLSTEEENGIIEHILSFPAVDSHYCRKSSEVKYLDPSLNISIMYAEYKKKCEGNGTKAACLEMYRRAFRKFKLSFHKPRKDKCKRCVAYKEMSNAGDTANDESQKQHLLRKDQARSCRDHDKEAAKKNDYILAFNFDLEAVLYTPKGAEGPFFYVRKLAVYNLTIYNLANQDVTCYMWDETEGKRGSIEISTIIHKYISCKENIKYVKMMSDGCGGQQKNYHFCTMLLHTLQTHPTLEQIDHRFFESGHTQMECDSIHSKIEQKAKNVPIYTPDGWAQTVRMARTNPKPYDVKMLNHEDFLDFGSKIQYQLTTDDNENENAMKIHECVWIQYRKDFPETIFIKHTYDSEEPFKRMEMKKKRGKMSSSVVKRAYNERPKISSKKKEDLIKLCRDDQIPRMYHNFYNNLPSSVNARDALAEPDLGEESG